MQQLVFEAATLCGLGAAALAAMVMVGHGAGLTSMLMRTMVIGGSVFLFVVLGGQVIGRVLLEVIAKGELEDARTIAEAEEAAVAEERAGLKATREGIVSLRKDPGQQSAMKNSKSEDTVRSQAA